VVLNLTKKGVNITSAKQYKNGTKANEIPTNLKGA
jgi:hypothetical protein